MSTIGRLVVELGLDASKYHSVAGEAAERAKGLGGVLHTAMGTAAGFLTGGLITEGIGKIGEFLKISTEAAKEDQLSMAQLDAVIKSTGGTAGVTSEAAVKLAESLSGVTRYSKDGTLAAESMLLTFTNIKDNVFPEATQTVLNMSTALGQDTKNSAIQLGKALNDPIHGMTALSRVGVTFSDSQKAMIKHLQQTGDLMGAQKVILKELATEFGGSAVAAGKTAAGQADIMSHKFEEIQEKVGGVLIELKGKLMTTFGPTIIGMLQGFTDVLANPAVASTIETVGNAIGIVGKTISGLSGGGDPFGVVTNGVYSFLTALGMSQGQAASWAVGIGTFVGDAVTLFKHLVGWVQTNWPPFRDTIVSVFNAVTTWLQANWPAIQSIITTAFEQARAIVEPIINGIKSVVMTVFGAVSAFLATHGAEIQAFVAGAWEKISGIISGVVGVLQLTVIPMFQAIGKFISDNQSGIQSTIELVWGAIKLVVSTALDLISGIVNVVLKALKGDWAGAWAVIKETAVNIWKGIVEFFSGVPAQMLAMGKQTIEGFVQGLLKSADAVYAAFIKIINDNITKVKDFFGWHSPPPFALAMGSDIGNAIAAGILGSQAAVFGALGSVTGGLAVNIAGRAGSVNGPQVTPSSATGPSSSDGSMVQVIVNMGDHQVADVMGKIVYASNRGVYGN